MYSRFEEIKNRFVHKDEAHKGEAHKDGVCKGETHKSKGAEKKFREQWHEVRETALANPLPFPPIPNVPIALIGAWAGRFGNRMHQYAYAATWAAHHRGIVMLPALNPWWGMYLFDLRGVAFGMDYAQVQSYQSLWHIESNEWFDVRHVEHCKDPYEAANPLKAGIVIRALCAYSNAIFDGMSRRHLRSVFQFSDLVRASPTYKYWAGRKGTYDAAHVRRGDFKQSDVFFVIDRESYYRAMRAQGIDPSEVIWVSDDASFRHNVPGDIECDGSGLFPDWFGDFLILYFARRVFRANSSFSFWAVEISPHVKSVWSPDLSSLAYNDVDKDWVDVPFVEGNHPHWCHHPNLEEGSHLKIKE